MFKHKLILVLFILFFSQLLSISAFGNQQSTNFLSNSFSSPQPDNNAVDINAPSGMEKVRSNVVRNGGFEEEDNRYGPRYFDYSGYIAGYANSSYQDDVHSGLYAGYIGSQGTNQQVYAYSNSRNLQSTTPYAYIDQIIYLDFWFNAKANPDLSFGASSFLRVLLITSGASYFLYYMFSVNSVPGNSTYYAYFDTRESIGSWFNIHRNITLDIEQTFGSYDSSWFVSYIFFTTQSSYSSTGEIILLFDDVSITNSTSYEFLQDNGDFEDGDNYPWGSYRYSPGYAYLTSADYTEGSKALNLTTESLYDNAYGYINVDYQTANAWMAEPKGYYPSQPNNLLVNFDWKCSSSEILTPYQSAIFYLLLENSTYWGTLNFVLDINSETIPYANYTDSSYFSYYFKPNGFGENNDWHHFSLDVFSLLEELQLTHLVLTEINFNLRSTTDSESKIQLLVDALEIVTYANADPSFDESWHWESYDPIQGWICPFTDFYTNLTTDAHSGTYALNVSTHTNPGYRYVYRPMYLAIQDNLYIDFWWKLDYLSSDIGSYTFILFTLDDDRSLYYVLGSCADTIFTNNSQICYYYVENYNQTGIWNNIFRSISNDVDTAFGPGLWNITRMDLISNTITVSAKVSTLFDDLYFVRDVTPPEIFSIEQIPATPQYGEEVTVIIGAIDNIQIESVELYYKIGSASWASVSMVENGEQYVAQIPAATWNTVVQYYIVATDVYDNVQTLGSSSDPFSYIVDDFIDPLLTVEGPDTNVTTHMDLQFNLTGSDPGSGIASFTVEDENGTLYDDTTIPTTFTWETAEFANGMYTISFILEDNAGNTAQVNLIYTINITTTTTKHGGLPISLGIILFSLIATSIIVRRKKT